MKIISIVMSLMLTYGGERKIVKAPTSLPVFIDFRFDVKKCLVSFPCCRFHNRPSTFSALLDRPL